MWKGRRIGCNRDAIRFVLLWSASFKPLVDGYGPRGRSVAVLLEIQMFEAPRVEAIEATTGTNRAETIQRGGASE